MNLNFRNLLLLACLCGIISSLSISSETHQSHNRHVLNLHEAVQRFVSHDQQANGSGSKFVTDIQTNIDLIVNSIQQSVPAIIQTKNIPTFSFPKSTCDSLTVDQKKQLKDKLKTAKQNVTDFKSKLDATKDKKVIADADNSLAYFGVIEILLDRTCRDVQNLLIGPSTYQTNINTNQSWILGGITLNDLVKQYVKRITDNNNVTNCGTQTPFWTGEKCIKCEAPKNIFNIATGQCTQCPDGTIYNGQTKTCVPGAAKFKPNKNAEATALVPKDAPTNALPDYLSSGDQQCPLEKPHVQNNVCIHCPTDKPLFNIISKQCQPCKTGFVFDSKTQKCIEGKPIATDVPVQTPRLKMNADSTDTDWNNYVDENKDKILCPLDTPFWDGTKCIQCPALFNIITKKCDVCQGVQKLNQHSHKCQPAQPLQPQLIDLFNAIF